MIRQIQHPILRPSFLSVHSKSDLRSARSEIRPGRLLGDDLTIDQEDGFSPTVGQEFILVSATAGAGIAGLFDIVVLPTAPADTQWDFVVGVNQVSLALLSVPPKITEVRIGSTGWNQKSRDSTDPDGQGYLLSRGAQQLADIPFAV